MCHVLYFKTFEGFLFQALSCLNKRLDKNVWQTLWCFVPIRWYNGSNHQALCVVSCLQSPSFSPFVSLFFPSPLFFNKLWRRHWNFSDPARCTLNSRVTGLFNAEMIQRTRLARHCCSAICFTIYDFYSATRSSARPLLHSLLSKTIS